MEEEVKNDIQSDMDEYQTDDDLVPLYDKELKMELQMQSNEEKRIALEQKENSLNVKEATLEERETTLEERETTLEEREQKLLEKELDLKERLERLELMEKNLN